MHNYGEKNYLGLDLGTSSVGWAVTDENYNLRRAKGKDLWGARLFDEAQPSVERRTHRTSRRRAQREKARISMLRGYFEKEINKIDAGFFVRLEESKYHFEDRSENNQQRYAIFNDDNYTDEDFYKEYPTVFHLRKRLIESKQPMDVRMVYLALLNMYKHRGNFLNSSLDSDEINMGEAWQEFIDANDKFESEEKMEFINLLNNEVSINGRSEYVVNAIKIYTRSIFDALQENDVSMIRFYEL